MYIRNYISFIIWLACAISLPAQDFVSLDWSTSRQGTLPFFKGAVLYPESILPNYIQSFDLGRDYSSHNYQVKVEYPEFRELKKEEADTLNLLGEKIEDHLQVKTSLSVSAKKGILEANFVPLIYKDGKYMKLIAFKLTVYKTLNYSRAAGMFPDRYTESSALSKGKWVKIRVTDRGVYRMTNSELSAMGFANPAKVRLYGYGGLLLPEKVGAPLVDDLQEVPLWRENNAVLFYANGTVTWTKNGDNPVTYKHTQNYYSGYSYYFLTESDEAPKSFPQEHSLSEEGAVSVTTFPDYTFYEKDGHSWMEGGRQFFEDYDYKVNATKTYTLNAPGIVSTGPASVNVSFSAYGKELTTVDVNVNGGSLGKLSIKAVTDVYEVARVVEQRFDWTANKSEKVTVSLTHNRASTISGRLDYIRLNYTRNLTMAGSYLCFRGNSDKKTKFVVAGANADTRIWNVTDVNNYRQVNGNLTGGNYTFVTDNLPGGEYVAVNTKGSFGKVEVVGGVPNQNLHALKAVDMVIIVPPNTGLMAQAERLAQAHRDKDNLKVEVVTSEQIYNEFSSGTPDATAYRSFMKMLYDRAVNEQEQPKYLLLFGDAAWDNRMITSSWKNYSPKDFLLCFESENSVSHTQSYVLEDYFGFLDDGEGTNFYSDKVDIGIGRFPVRTAEQASQMVDKTIDYMYNKEAGAWRNVTCFMGDDEQDNLAHVKDATKMANIVEKYHPELLVKKIYWDAYDRVTNASGNSYPGAQKEILDLTKSGALIISYCGHANPSGLSHEWVLRIKDVKEMNSPRPALWFTMGCDVGPFDGAGESFGEELFLNPKGGAIGSITSTRTTYAGSNSNMGAAFIKYALMKTPEGKPFRLGDAMRESRSALITGAGGKDFDSDRGLNKLQYVLLGDPALALNAYNRNIVVDEFNGKAATESTDMKAGSKVTVKGRVVDNEGNIDPTFNGIIYPNIMDHEETLLTKGHDGTTPYEYNVRSKKLFAGADSIRSGEFSFTFPVPMDISYSFDSGLLNLYALDGSKEKEGKGLFTNFLVGGTEDGAMKTDSLGPKIFMYLNTPDFPYGGQVNGTPVLVAELEDEDGINVVGSGIGHDLVAVIDNSPAYSYVLNSYYAPNFGSYTGGIIRYPLGELSEGKHKVMLRAWDMKNNSSTSELEFTVNYSLRPNFDITCMSPAKNKTTFIISHDRPESELDFNVCVYDFSGREMWVHTEKGFSSDSVYYMDWDLTSNGGQRLQPGVYLFRATVSSGGSKETTKSRKIVILAQ